MSGGAVVPLPLNDGGGAGKLLPCLPQYPTGDNDPKAVEDNNIQHEVQEAIGSQRCVASQHLRQEGHEASVDLGRCQHNHHEPHLCLDRFFLPRLPASSLIDPIADQGGGDTAEDHSDQLNRDDGRVGTTPAVVC